MTIATRPRPTLDSSSRVGFDARRANARRYAADGLLILLGAISGIQIMGFTFTMLSTFCLILAPAILLVRPTVGQVIPLVLALVAFVSFVISSQINHLSVVDQRVTQWASFAIYFVGFLVLVGRDLERAFCLLCGVAIGAIGYMETAGPPYSGLSTIADLWKYELAPWVTIVALLVLTLARVGTGLQAAFLVFLAGFSLLENYRSHAIVCLATAAAILVGLAGAGRMARWLQLALVGTFGYAVSIALPAIARSGIAGEAIQAKTELQDSSGVPALLAGRTESPLSIAAILDRPWLGWGSADNISPEVFERAEAIAIKIGFDPTLPIQSSWYLENGAVSLHSVLLTSWAEGGIVAALLPLALLGAALTIVWNAPRYGRWSVLAVVVSVQAAWDLFFSPTSYNTLPTFAMLAVVFAARHLPSPAAAQEEGAR